MSQVTKNVVVINSQFEIVTTFETSVSAVAVARFDKVSSLTERSIAHHVAAVVNDDWTFTMAPSSEVINFSNAHSICAITGGSIADVLMGKTIKDIDALFVTAEPGYYSLTGDKDCDEHYFGFEGVEYPLSKVLGYLTMPHCYARLNNVFQVYKAEEHKVDFLFSTMPESVRTGSPHDILNTIVNEYDQDIKLGFYYNDRFYIHVDMYKALNNNRVGFNKSFLSNLSLKGELVTQKEVSRLEKARTKYTPFVVYSEDIMSEYSLSSLSEHGYKTTFGIPVPVQKVHPNLV
jgi:hypothetical protein